MAHIEGWAGRGIAKFIRDQPDCRAVHSFSRLLAILGLVHGGLRGERIFFVGGIRSVVGTMDELVLFALLPLGRFFALFVLASQLFLSFLESCA
jgi:hypothetical protein